MSEEKGSFAFLCILIMGIFVMVIAANPDDSDSYYMWVGITIWEFDTKAEAVLAESIIENEYGGRAGILRARGPFWNRIYPVEIVSSHYWDKPENYFSWNDELGQKIVRRINRKVEK